MTTRIEPPRGFRGGFLLDNAGRAPYSRGSGILQAFPAAVAIPYDEADVVALATWASATETALVPRGAGTGMPGGNVGSGVTVDLMTGFQRIGPVDSAARLVRVEPGATLAELNAACAPTDLYFPVDPSSGARCSLGGMLANNSSGAHSVKYGPTRRWVHAMDVVLADGSRARVERGVPPGASALREIAQQIDSILLPNRELINARWPRVRKNSSGYALLEYLASGDLIDLLIGSEGTLALTVGAALRLAQIPALRGLAILEFTSLESAGDAIQTVLSQGPATCEMLDRTFLELVRSADADAGYPLRPGLEAILFVEMEGETLPAVREGLQRVEESVRGLASRVSLAVEPSEQDRFWAVRHAASPIIAERAGSRVSMQFIEDTVVPVASLPAYVLALRAILARHSLPAVIFGHAGDGNLHVNPLVDVGQPGWRLVIETVLDEVASLVASLGGTLSGEHGDGRLRAPLLETIWDTDIVALFRAVKTEFDPRGILNPGVILPVPGQHAFDALKHYS